jgi:hypothetical protein
MGFLLIVVTELLTFNNRVDGGQLPGISCCRLLNRYAVLKGSLQTGSTRQRMRQALVGVQLVLSIFLISSTLIMQAAVEFSAEQESGI